MTVGYESAVKDTFVESLKSVFLVDDAFPTFSDMFGNAEAIEKFMERERARKLYSAFRDKHLPCDIENTFTPGDLLMVERLRKCDLIVLDFHLDGEGGDNSKSVEILRKLADSPHFNTVIVYTNAELDQVWLDVASNLRPDLRLAPFLEQNQDEAAWWAETNSDDLVQPTVESIVKYVTRGMAAIRKETRAEIIARIIEKGGKGRGDPSRMAEMLIRSVIDKRRPASIKKYDDEDKLGSRSLQGRFSAGKPHWLQCRGCFIAIVKKSEEEDEVAVLMNSLNEALLDWKPNFLQILVSEIQNRLELELVAADPRVFSDANRQVGLSHYLLEQLEGDEDPETAVESVVDRIVETLRHRIAGDRTMREFATGVLADVRKTLGKSLKSADRIANAAAFAHVEDAVEPNRVVSFLNAFLSTEAFAKSRITTGSVFSKDDDYWMVATPACDLTSRVPGAAQAWMKSIHPVRAMLAVKLRKVDLKDALAVATQGRHAFVIDQEQIVCLSFLDRTTAAPDAEMFFTIDAGKITSGKDTPPVFRALRVVRTEVESKLSEPADYTVIGQLRPNYASRVLQLTGAHLSRIGIDFFNVGSNEDV
jgi:hypothetical protein